MGGCHFINCCWQFSSQSVMLKQGQCPLWTGGSSVVSLTMDVFITPLLGFETYTSLTPNSKLSGLAGGAPDMFTPCTSLAHWNGSVWRPIIFCLLHVTHRFSPPCYMLYSVFIFFFPLMIWLSHLTFFEHQFSVFAN